MSEQDRWFQAYVGTVNGMMSAADDWTFDGLADRATTIADRAVADYDKRFGGPAQHAPAAKPQSTMALCPGCAHHSAVNGCSAGNTTFTSVDDGLHCNKREERPAPAATGEAVGYVSSNSVSGSILWRKDDAGAEYFKAWKEPEEWRVPVYLGPPQSTLDAWAATLREANDRADAAEKQSKIDGDALDQARATTKAWAEKCDTADDHARQQDERVARLVESIGVEREKARSQAARVEGLEAFVAAMRVADRKGYAANAVCTELRKLDAALSAPAAAEPARESCPHDYDDGACRDDCALYAGHEGTHVSHSGAVRWETGGKAEQCVRTQAGVRCVLPGGHDFACEFKPAEPAKTCAGCVTPDCDAAPVERPCPDRAESAKTCADCKKLCDGEQDADSCKYFTPNKPTPAPKSCGTCGESEETKAGRRCNGHHGGACGDSARGWSYWKPIPTPAKDGAAKPASPPRATLSPGYLLCDTCKSNGDPECGEAQALRGIAHTCAAYAPAGNSSAPNDNCDPHPAPDAFIDIVFDGPPGPVCGRFVEVELPDGRSCNVGEWIDRKNGLWALRIPRAHPAPDAGRDATPESIFRAASWAGGTREEALQAVWDHAQNAVRVELERCQRVVEAAREVICGIAWRMYIGSHPMHRLGMALLALDAAGGNSVRGEKE